MPGPERDDIVIGADGFLGRNPCRGSGPRAARSSRSAARRATCPTGPMSSGRCATPPRAGRIFHVVTRQRTGAIQYDIQGELLAINTHPPERPRGVAPVPAAGQARLPRARPCTYPESAEPLPERAFGQGPTQSLRDRLRDRQAKVLRRARRPTRNSTD